MRHIDYEAVIITLSTSAGANALPGYEEISSNIAALMYSSFLTPSNTTDFYRNVNPTVGDISIDFVQNTFDTDTYKARYVDFNTFEYLISTKVTDGTLTHYVITASRTNVSSWKITSITYTIEDNPTVFQPASFTAEQPMMQVDTTRRLSTPTRNVYCEVDSENIACVNKNNDGMYCSQNLCEYDETGELAFRTDGVITRSIVTVGSTTCSFTETDVRCNARQTGATTDDTGVQLHR